MTLQYWPPAAIITVTFRIDDWAWYQYPNLINRSNAYHSAKDDCTYEMGNLVNGFVRIVQGYTPVFSGNLKSSIGRIGGLIIQEYGEITSVPNGFHVGSTKIYDELVLTGGVHTNMDPTNPNSYALPVETGSRPHRPPMQKLYGWAVNHGMSPWALQSHIALMGTKERAMFRQGFYSYLGVELGYGGAVVPTTYYSMKLPGYTISPGEVDDTGNFRTF